MLASSCALFRKVRLANPERRLLRFWAMPENVASTGFAFGPVRIDSDQIFFENESAYSFVNLKPLLPGHVLVAPKRSVKRFTELSDEEAAALWILAKRVGRTLEEHLEGDSLTFAIQDGPAAGQTIPHVHIHVLPRKTGDFENNDDIYEALDKHERDTSLAMSTKKLDLDIERKARTPEEMSREAASFRKLFRDCK